MKSEEHLDAQLSNIWHLFLRLNLWAQNPKIEEKKAYFEPYSDQFLGKIWHSLPNLEEN